MRAGFAQVDITPDIGVPLGGNVREDKAARGTHDPLFANIAVLGSDRPIVLIGMDLLGVTATFTAAICAAVHAATGIPAEQVVTFATHTHSGPDTSRGSGFDRGDYSAVDVWEQLAAPAIAQGVADAVRNAAGATVNVARGQAPGYAFNRRLLLADGTVRMNWSAVPDSAVPAGPVDDEITLWTFRGLDGAAVGALVHFTLHPAILVGHDWLYSADYIAALTATIRARVGDVPVIFANGALGNVNHLDHRDNGRAIGFGEAERVGAGIGASLSALSDAVIPEPGVRMHRTTIELDQRTVDRERAAWARRTLRANGAAPVDVLDGVPDAAYACWTLERGKHLAPLMDVPVAAVELGDTVFVFLPFEVFVEFGLGIRDALPGKIIRVVSLAHDYLGYLPTRDAFEQGGYEPTFGTSTIDAGQGEYLFGQIAAWLRGEVEGSA